MSNLSWITLARTVAQVECIVNQDGLANRSGWLGSPPAFHKTHGFSEANSLYDPDYSGGEKCAVDFYLLLQQP